MPDQQVLRHLLQALKTEADTVVCLDSDKKPMTLKQVFQSMNLTAYDLTVDMLDVHAVSHPKTITLASKLEQFTNHFTSKVVQRATLSNQKVNLKRATT